KAVHKEGEVQDVAEESQNAKIAVFDYLLLGADSAQRGRLQTSGLGNMEDLSEHEPFIAEYEILD
ncbi:hypothetical protein ABEB36_013889, partial [Hypothenemus hampei]